MSVNTFTNKASRVKKSGVVQALPFVLPPAVLMGWFIYGAIGWNLIISLTDWNGLGKPSYGSLDLEMYRQMLHDPGFINATVNTIILLVAFTVAALAIGLVLAIALDREIRFKNTFRTIYLLPMGLSFVVTALFWSWMYNPEFGLVNIFLNTVGLGEFTTGWLSDPNTKLWAIIFALVWQFSGYAMVVFLAGLRAIPDAHYEAAKTDGASMRRIYQRIIVPQLRPAVASASIVLMTYGLKAFDFIFVLYSATPGPSADILGIMIYRKAFARFNWAYGSSIATFLFVLTLAIIGPYLYTQYRRGDL